MLDYQTTCAQYLDRISARFDYLPINGSDLEHTILRTLVGTQGTTRNGSEPSIETSTAILNRIREKVKQNRPLELTSAWGGIKTIPSKDRGVDLAELLTIKQYHAISQVIRKIYAPGVRFNIFPGDSYYAYLYGEDCRIENYCENMEIIVKDYEEINLVRLSKLCQDSSRVTQQCQNNYELLHQYWVDTSEIPPESHTNILSYRKLLDSGWIGEITPAMREFYLKRMSTLYPEASLEFRQEKVLRFFAYGLMISQNDLMGRKDPETCTVDVCLLRVPPPDLPRKLHSNRLRMRIAPESIVNSTAPPWSVAGTLCMNNGAEPRISLLDATSYQTAELEEIKYNGITFSIVK